VRKRYDVSPDPCPDTHDALQKSAGSVL
jgi:hypothetical protein